MNRKQPLYRSVNTQARNLHHRVGGNFRDERAEFKAGDKLTGTMHGRKERGLDYTPLCRFLLSKVGSDWDAVFSEAASRLDKPEAVYWMVARTRMPWVTTEGKPRPYVRIGESSYWSGLYVDENNVLQLVDPTWTVERMAPTCACCTHTLNGVRFTRKFEEGVSEDGSRLSV
jgi:hypothetical protein